MDSFPEPSDSPKHPSPTTTRARDPALSEPGAKRRKVRKGTRSCWECKRRKVRCNFVSEHDAVCIGCRQRGTKCVSQEFPEEASAPADRSRQMGDRIVRVEALVEQLVKSVASGSNKPATPDAGIPTPSSSTSELPQILSLCDESSPEETPQDADSDITTSPAPNLGPTDSSGPPRIPAAISAKYQDISDALCAAFPSSKDLEILRGDGATAVMSFNQMVSIPLPVLEASGLETSDVWFKVADRTQHPLLIAKHMMMLATSLQSLYPHAKASIRGLSEAPLTMTRRLADAARSLVTHNDEFLGTIEGLQCMLFEGMYQANWGNLRRAWLAFRRAMVAAQLMGIHRAHNHKPLKVVDPKAAIYPQYLWYRIVFADRSLCMMLGLPQGTQDISMASPAQLAGDAPSGRLERIHCVLSARILERNESDPDEDDYKEAKVIDSELQKAATMMPGKWWLAPNLSKVANEPRAMFWEALRLAKQLYHYYLLIQLHLPYMLLSSNPNPSSDTGKQPNYGYSKSTCVTASREILSRFIVYRSFNRAVFCCRNIDFYAMMAAMTLLLAYLDGHRQRTSENILAHQRFSDRAMMEEVLENMECVSKLNDDILSDKCGNLLRRLLAIEEEAAAGNEGVATEALEDSIETALRICIPYYGTVKINPTGIISRDGPGSQQPQSHEMPAGAGDSGTIGSVGTQHRAWGCGLLALPGDVGREAAASESSSCPFEQHDPHADTPYHAQVTPAGSTGGFSHESTGPSFQHSGFSQQLGTFANDPTRFESYPDLTAGIDDWAFQGVDMAFFDTLMRGAGAPDAEDMGNWRL